MAYRINKAQLESMVERINEATGHPLEAWTKQEDGKYKANIGTYVLDWAYGGVRLSQMASEGGGQRDITGRGTKRETYERMHCYLKGIWNGRQEQ